ncbi:MAG: Histone H1-like nucleoprotein [Frankiaceae bacterium]|jgi:hypothetical protein|nr:Histone H1-like nucleoprotein [Frankiaceae bacterium]MDX6223950.1 Histone H1-like nucleoprotein [Frankiales bacterium]
MTTATRRKSGARKTTAKKTTARKATAKKTTARKTSARKTTARKSTARKSTARKTAARKTTASAPRASAPPAGSADLAGGLRAYLGAVDAEVRAVSALSERIDSLVADLNAARDEQAKRLIVLDELRASVSDGSLGSFLDQAIRPRKTRVVEVVPKRLR